jgi:hypothetical protein
MLRKILCILLFISTGCNPTRDRLHKGNLPYSLPDADIVFQTIEIRENQPLGKDMLGFYSLWDGSITKFDFGNHLIDPYYLDSTTLVSVNKQGNPGSIHGFIGYLFIVKDNSYLGCETSLATGGYSSPFKGDILIYSQSQINLLDGKDCSLKRVIFSEQNLPTLGTKQRILSFSLSQKEDFLILSISTLEKLFLIRMNLIADDYIIFEENGYFPSISPDQSKIVYLGRDGIHLMSVKGENNELLVPYETKYDNKTGSFWRDELPTPKWSIDGTKLIYHKCIQSIEIPCYDISNYQIFEYDLGTRTESMLIKEGLYPSWRP